ISFAKIIALQHPRNGMTGCQLEHPRSTQRIEPARVEHYFSLLRFEYLEHLRLIGFCVLPDLLLRQWRTRCAFAAGITNSSSKIAYQKQYLMPQILKLA